MSTNAILTTVENYINSSWPDEEPEICWQETNPPKAGTVKEWLRVHVGIASKEKRTGCRRYRGVITVGVFTAPNETAQRSTTLIDRVDDLLSSTTITETIMVRTNSPQFSDAGVSQGWHHSVYRVSFVTDIF